MALGNYEKVTIDGIVKNKEDFYYEDFSLSRRKYTDDELIEYLLNTVIKGLSGSKEIKSKLLERYFLALYTIFEYCIATEREFSDDLAKRTIALKSDYIEYLKRLELASDEQTERRLLDLVELVVNNRAFVDESILNPDSEVTLEQDESTLAENQEECHFDEYQNDSLQLQSEIKELETKIDSYEKDNNKKSTLIKELKEAKKALEKQLQEYKSKVNASAKEKEKFQRKVTRIEDKLGKANKTINSLNEKVSIQDKTNNELHNKLKTEEELNKELSNTIKQEQKKLDVYSKKEQRLLELQIIEREIILLISQKQLTIREITEELNNKGFLVTNEELHFLLARIRNQINIEPLNKTIPATYHIERINNKNSDLKNNSYRLITGGELEIKILLVADAHSDIKKLSTFDAYKSLYDYSLKHNINNIFLLGDFFDCSNDYDLSKKEEFYDAIMYYQENISMFLDKYPHCDEITNSFLGGNHEKIMFDVGINPVSIIANSRLDFVSLGYNDAEVIVKKDKFVVHHPNRVVNLPKDEAVKNYLRNYYKNSSLNRNESYIDIFGHFHTNCLSQTNGYLLLPSLTLNGEGVKGACEMRIYLNEEGYIDNIIFVPLVYRRKNLVGASEIEYKKLVLENK